MVDGRFRHYLIGEMQPEIELLEVRAFISIPFRQKLAVQSHLQPKEHSIAGLYVQFYIFLKKTLMRCSVFNSIEVEVEFI